MAINRTKPEFQILFEVWPEQLCKSSIQTLENCVILGCSSSLDLSVSWGNLGGPEDLTENRPDLT